MRGLELRLTKEASLGSFPPSLGRFERFQVYSLVRSRHGYLISLPNYEKAAEPNGDEQPKQ